MTYLPLPLRQKPSLCSFKCSLIIKTFLLPKLQPCHVFCSMLMSSSIKLCIVRILVCAGARVRACVCACLPACVCVCARALRIVSMGKILRFENTSVIIINSTWCLTATETIRLIRDGEKEVWRWGERERDYIPIAIPSPPE